MTVTHSSFTLEREYAASPARVFASFSTREEKAKWFGDPAFPPSTWEFDFREGGREYESGEFHGQISTFDAIYHDIVENERIVFSYVMHFGDAKLSASLQSIVLTPTATGTRLVLTEDCAYFDGNDNPEARKEGTRGLLEQLAIAVEN
jgi:uncharacterized protein YndB with AHSA1/START domain